MSWIILHDIYVLILVILAIIVRDVNLWTLFMNIMSFTWLSILLCSVLDKLDELKEVLKHA
jgi:hypothetical protein